MKIEKIKGLLMEAIENYVIAENAGDQFHAFYYLGQVYAYIDNVIADLYEAIEGGCFDD